MVAASGEVGADPYVGYCASLRRELSGEPDVGNLHLRFDEGRGTFPVPSYSTGSSKRRALHKRAATVREFRMILRLTTTDESGRRWE